MQKQIILLFTVTIIGMMGIVACTQADTASEAASHPPQIAATSTPAAASYQEKMDAAQAAFDAADFEQAMSLAKDAANFNPNLNTPWELYRKAAIAAAADSYLTNLPQDRYRIDPQHFLANLVNGEQYFVLDVREPDEYAEGHIDNAVNVPLREITQNLDKLPDSKSHPILVYCHSQKRSTHALVVLRELGYTNVHNLEGGYSGYQEWTENNPLPTPGPTATPEPEKPSC